MVAKGKFKTKVVKFMIHFHYPLLKFMLTFALQYKMAKFTQTNKQSFKT
ncbi:hypothetical protein [Campylobacter concisus]|nr:hypothetical protein [Campylobacter concisus]